MGKFLLMAALGALTLLAVAYAMTQPGFYSSTEESAEFLEIMLESTETRKLMEDVRAACRNNSGSDEAYVALTEAIHSAMVCVKASVDLENFLSDVDTISNEARGTFFPKYCPQLKRAGTCLDDVLEAVRPCLQKHSFTNVLAVAGMYPDAVDLVCKNDGEIIFKLAEPTYEECIYELKDNVRECTVPFDKECKNWDFSNLTQTQLGTFSRLRQCMEDKLNVCKAPGVISVYDVFHSSVLRLDSCINVRPFLENYFVPSVAFLSIVAHNETNTANEN